MLTIKDLHDADLLFILKCQKLKEVNEQYENKLKIDTSHYPKIKYPNNKISQSFESAILGGPIGWIYTALWVFNLIDPGFLKPITLSLAGLMGIMGGIDFASNYRSAKKDEKQIDKTLELLNIKREAIDELLLREHEKIDKLSKSTAGITLDVFGATPSPKPSNRLEDVKTFCKTMLLTSSVLFGTYYLTAPTFLWVVGAKALAIALMGPIALGVAFIGSVGLAGYFGYKEYKNNKAAKAFIHENKNIKEEIASKKEKYDLLVEKYDGLVCQKNKENEKAKAQAEAKMQAEAKAQAEAKLQEQKQNNNNQNPVPADQQKNNIPMPQQYANNPMILANQKSQKKAEETETQELTPNVGFGM